jgi:hypothetical protein
MATAHPVVAFSASERQRILAHLEDVLASGAFAGSRRRQAFLRYVVEETVAGRGAAIKETSIAVDVFGRTSDFDAQSASVVRVTGGEVRKRLARMYDSGFESDVRIELPLGSYQPVITLSPEIAATEKPLEAPPAIQDWTESPRRRMSRRLWLAAAIGLLTVSAAVVLARTGFRQRAPLDLFWQPFLDRNQPVLISMVAPTLLYPTDRDKWIPLPPGKSIPTSELQVMENSYVGTGAALGSARFAEQLASRQQRFVLKFGSDLTFADLKNFPAILIGVSKWTQDLTRNLRFRLRAEEGRFVVVDSRKADSGRIAQGWEIARTHEVSQMPEGYSLITRLLHSDSAYPVLFIVGMDARNTQAAVEFLTRTEAFEQFSSVAPAGWPDRNFQVVLHNTIHGNSAGALKVVAFHIW